jgi:hypothetical protein
MDPGISYVYRHVNGPYFEGRADNEINQLLAPLETRARFDTLQTITEYADSKEVVCWLKDVVRATWGDARRGEKPIWEHDLMRNTRSGKGTKARPFDGSYSLGITVEECDTGYVGKAKQPVSGEVPLWCNIILTHLRSAAFC